ncbi:MAG TPA: metallophosphoesterase [Candidatus Saccharimonadales bacterium]|nr:metallophosphoesterase [Candidatus Saccharimonadales bacterium]
MSSKCVPIYPHPILFVETSDNKKFLTISDVHIGCEDRANQAGVFVKTEDNVKSLLEILLTIQLRTGIENLIILGDLKSSTSIISRTEWNNVPYFIKTLMKTFTIYIIPGNHDGNIRQLLPDGVNLMLAKGMLLDHILFIHGHINPRIGPNLKKIIAGHLHPVMKKEGSILNGAKVWVKIDLSRVENNGIVGKAVDRNLEVILVPHFNHFLDFFIRSSSRKFESNTKSKLPFLGNMLHKQNWQINNAYMYTLDGSIIGTVDDVRRMLYMD